MIFPNDHTPSHVHCFKAEGEAVINIGYSAAAPAVREVKNMSAKDVKKALKIVAVNQLFLLDKWREIHG